jgi:hypothetical protein
MEQAHGTGGAAKPVIIMYAPLIDMNPPEPTHQLLEMTNAAESSRRKAVGETSLSLARKTRAVLLEPFLTAKVVLCWVLALPVVVLCLCSQAIWHDAVSAWLRLTTRQERAPVQLSRA